MENNILERIPGFNDKEMADQCQLLYNVVFATYDVKEGRGKNIIIKKEFKHNVPTDVRERIKNSLEYYKKKAKENN